MKAKITHNMEIKAEDLLCIKIQTLTLSTAAVTTRHQIDIEKPEATIGANHKVIIAVLRNPEERR